MTGGLAYVLRAEADDVLHRDFVTLAELDADEELWLRRTLEEHVHFTASPRAARLLSRHSALPLLRVQPIHFQGTVEATWSPVLAQLKRRHSILPAPLTAPISQAALHGGERPKKGRILTPHPAGRFAIIPAGRSDYGLRSTDYFRLRRQTQELFSRGPESLPLAIRR